MAFIEAFSEVLPRTRIFSLFGACQGDLVSEQQVLLQAIKTRVYPLLLSLSSLSRQSSDRHTPCRGVDAIVTGRLALMGLVMVNVQRGSRKVGSLDVMLL
jgi:hypothetical protein